MSTSTRPSRSFQAKAFDGFVQGLKGVWREKLYEKACEKTREKTRLKENLLSLRGRSHIM